jgi:putative transposase
LGLWIGEHEGVHFWMAIFDELKARGVERMLFVCIDGLKGLGQSILNIFPNAHVQRCMAPLQRNSLRYIPTKHCKQFCKDARAIYAAVSRQAAEEALRSLAQTWAEYPAAVRVRTDNFEHVERLFELPAHIRRTVCTTNMIEGFHSARRKVTRGKAAFPDNDAVFRALYLRTTDVTKNGMPIPNWAPVLGQIVLLFPDSGF